MKIMGEIQKSVIFKNGTFPVIKLSNELSLHIYIHTYLSTRKLGRIRC